MRTTTIQRSFIMSPVTQGSVGSLKELLIEQLNDLYAAEKHMETVLPKLADAAAAPRLSECIRGHLVETKEHTARLERVFRELGAKPKQVESRASRGELEDCEMLLCRGHMEPRVRDAAIVATAQRLEHGEMAGYGCARAWASLLGYANASAELLTTLAEERRHDAELSRIGESLNKAALDPMMSTR
jgi:ferritin-like metal-binding protein YciE